MIEDLHHITWRYQKLVQKLELEPCYTRPIHLKSFKSDNVCPSNRYDQAKKNAPPFHLTAIFRAKCANYYKSHEDFEFQPSCALCNVQICTQILITYISKYVMFKQGCKCSTHLNCKDKFVCYLLQVGDDIVYSRVPNKLGALITVYLGGRFSQKLINVQVLKRLCRKDFFSFMQVKIRF